MTPFSSINKVVYRRQTNFTYKNNWQRFHIDLALLTGILILVAYGLMILFSASSKDQDVMIRQCLRFLLAFAGMFAIAQIQPARLRTWAPWLYFGCLFLLFVVMVIGDIGKGAQRWLDLGVIRFQPSEMMKLSMPMMLAWYFHEKPLPPTLLQLAKASLMILIPVLLVAKQPDLGTALVILFSGGSVILFAGVSWRLILIVIAAGASFIPVLWHFLHNYQRERVLTFLNPERDPLGSGYHIIQSKIAIGSGGLFGKGWFNSTQSHLSYLPEHTTDFIFAVCGEEFGLIGCTILVVIYIAIVGRCLMIAASAQDTFSRLLAAAIALLFFASAFVNIGMVTGVLPVVGLPLPMVSYGGTSIVTLMIGFGMLMSIQTHRALLGR